MFLSAGLVLSGCGDDDTATTPAPAPPPPPPPAPEPEPEPEPEAPATPTGFHVDTTQTSLTWHWNAVEGAIGYAVQVSTDEMFDDTDTITPTAETSFTVADLPPQTTLYARVAAAGGTLEAPLLSAWTTHVTGTTDMPPPPPPPPMAPATPTGFMVESDMTSITWSWDAVEGALGYAIQVSEDEMFDDMDHLGLTLETSHTVSPLPPGTTLFARVASGTGTPEAIAAAVATGSLEGLLVSAWTTHMTGMTEVPPPPPPPTPDPVEVTFSLSEDADSPHFLVADDDDDEATAMASVNSEIMVNSNTDAIITPMFVDGANGVSVMEGDNMPFGRVSWGLMQSAVISDGATFMVQRAVIGANQEMEPSGDVAYVTCGPFECVDGEDAPELSITNSAVCTAWDPTVEIQVGKVDNDVIPPTTAAADGTIADDAEAYATGVDTNDGVDLGIVTSSTLAMNVKHVFSGVAGGANTTKTVEAAKGSDKTLAMAAVASITVDADVDVTGAGTAAAPYGINESAVCEDTADGMGRYDEGDLTDKPEGCFRLRGPGAGRGDNDPSKGADYLSGWTIELSPVGGDVAWGRVDWDDDPFEDLTCGDAEPIVVADHVDICSMFEDEVDNATGKGWKPTVVFRSETAGFTETSPPTGNEVVMWKADADPASGYTKMFKTIWFDDNLDGKILKDTETRPEQRLADDSANVAGDKFNDLYNHNSRDANIEQIWELLTDSNDDLTGGDLGKVDLVSTKDDRDTEDDERTILVEACPANTSYAPRDGYGTSGEGTAKVDGNLDSTPCKTTAQRRDRLAGVARETGTATAAHPDGNADNYEVVGTRTDIEHSTDTENTAKNRTVSDDHKDFFECSEDDGGDDDDGSICDAEWTRDAEVTFADGTFGCSTTRMVSVTCTWDADGGMAQGRNALPSAFTAANKKFFLKCEAE